MSAQAYMPNIAHEHCRKAPHNPRGIFKVLKPENFKRDNLQSALYRYFTFLEYCFPALNSPRIAELADAGLYLSQENTVECQFCFGLSVPISEFCGRLNGMSMKDFLDEHLAIAPYCPIKHNDIKNFPLKSIGDDTRYEIIRLYSLLEETTKTPQLWSNADPLQWCLDLAKDGFIFKGPNDRVRCVYCRLEISCWSEADQVSDEHQSSNPRCPFITHTPSVGNVPLGMEQIHGVGTDANVFAQPTSSGEKFYFPNYASQDLREQSFKSPRWQYQVPNLSGKRMAKSGFFYTGQDNLVACFMCGIGLKNWSNEDVPEEVHKRLNHFCPLNQ